MLRHALPFCSLLLLVMGCGQKTFDTEEEIITYLTDPTNGYLQKKTVNSVDFSLMYRPTDLLVKQELGEEINDPQKVVEAREKYQKYIYFNLSMSKNNQELLSVAPKNRNEFGGMVNLLAFGMQEKVHLFNGQKDTLQMVDFIYPRMYGMSQSTTILFVFPRNEEKLKDENLNFTIADLGLFTGEVKFKVEIDKIMNEPKLKF